MKRIKLKKYITKKYFVWIFLAGLLLVTSSMFMYKLFFINSDEKQFTLSSKKAAGIKKYMHINHDNAWCKRQQKYLDGGTIESITFVSRCDESASHEKTIMRNGILIQYDNAPATVLICHGFKTSKDDLGFLRLLFSGYNIVTFDFRAHGEDVEGQCCTFGKSEKYDVIAAAEYIRSHSRLKEKPLFVYGFSMGAVASIMAQAERPDLFDAAIWDCPFDSTEALISRSIEKMKFFLFGYDFSFPGRAFLKRYAYHPYVQNFFKAALKTLASMDATQVNTRIEPISPSNAVKKITIPSFFIACHNDDKAPPSAVLDIYKNSASKFKRCWISKGRKHYDAVFSNTEAYLYKVKSFFKKCLDGDLKNKKSAKVHEDEWVYKVQYHLS